MDLVFIIVVLSFAGLMQGLTGFGFGIVAMALLPFCMEFKLAATTVAAINLPMCLLTLWAYRQHFHWRDARGLIVGVALGAPLGVQLLAWGESTVLLRCLGGVMCGFALLDALLMRFRWGPIPKSCAIPLGFLTGVFGGAFNIGGPPAVAYTYSQPWTKQQVVAVLQAMFSVSAVVRVTMLTHAGLLNSEVGRLTSLSLIPVLIGIWCGSRLLNRISQAHLKTGVLIFVFVMGVKYLVSLPASVSKQISAAGDPQHKIVGRIRLNWTTCCSELCGISAGNRQGTSAEGLRRDRVNRSHSDDFESTSTIRRPISRAEGSSSPVMILPSTRTSSAAVLG